MIKPCVKCGAKDRYKRGDCKPCKKLAKAKWRKANSEKVKLDSANYRKANPEKQKLSVANWRKANPDALRIHCHNYRARKRDNGGKLSPDLAEILFKRQKGKCACCKEPLGKGYHLDHIMPLKLGGKNEDCNMQLLKASCNLQKHAKHPVEFMQNKGLLL